MPDETRDQTHDHARDERRDDRRDQLSDRLQRTLGDAYTLTRELGGGGMSRIFVARDRTLERDVVVKVLSPELAAGHSAERFARETRLAARLQQANIVPLLSAGETDGLPYYMMPFVDGLSLRTRLDRNGALPVPEAVGVLRDVARALAYAHEHGIVHRDIKPENVLLSGHAAVVTDFGIAKALSASRSETAPGGTLTQIGTSIGTPAYMAPEQASADPATDHRADLYALGCLAYEMLAGAPPFGGRPVHKMLAAHLNETPIPLQRHRTDVPRALASLVMHCLEKVPARRPQSAREVLDALDGLGSRSVVVATPRTWVAGALAAGLLAIAAGGTIALRGRGAAAPSPEGDRSIAVLPFVNPGGDTTQAYFAAGMADELTTAIGKVPGLRVASRSAALAFERKGMSAQEVGQALHVGAVLEGTVRRVNGRLRVTAQLTKVDDGLSLWSDSFERDVGDLFTVQDELARRIAQALHDKLALAGARATMQTARGTDDQQAYDLYLRGRFLAERRGDVALHRAADLFGRAVRRDSSFARAWAGLAMVQVLLPKYERAPHDSLLPAGMRNARHALALDSMLADAHLALAYGQLDSLEWKESEAGFRRALALEPDDAVAHHLYADLLYPLGRLDEALAEFRASERLDPSSAVVVSHISNTLYLMGRFGEAIATGRRAVEMDSTLPVFYANYAMAHTFRGEPDSSVVLLLRARRLSDGDPSVPGLTYALSAAGRGDEARRIADEAEAAARRGAATAFGAALARNGIGDREGTLRWLATSVERRESAAAFAAPGCEPMLDPLRQEPRFQELVRRLGVGVCPPHSPRR